MGNRWFVMSMAAIVAVVLAIAGGTVWFVTRSTPVAAAGTAAATPQNVPTPITSTSAAEPSPTPTEVQSATAPASIAPSTPPASGPATVSTPPKPTSSAPAANCEVPGVVPPGAAGLAAAVAAVEAGGTKVALAYVSPDGIVKLGSSGTTAAWSTSKVPLAVAVVRAGGAQSQASAIRNALRASDNDAAAQLWRFLGTDDQAAAKVTAVLRDAGDATTTVPNRQTYAPYSVFGQTMWPVEAQAAFVRRLPCLAGSSQVVAEMSQVVSSQRWGLGRLPGAVFKGGWGPGRSGGYEVRQLGWYDSSAGRVFVAVSVRAGSFDSGTAALDRLAAALGR